MSAFHVKLVAPTGVLFDGEATSLIAPGELGSFGILARHAPMISALRPGVLKIQTPDATRFYAVTTGILEVSEGQVSILADHAENAATAEEALALTRAAPPQAEPRKKS